jgi:hypothetical protein
MLRGRSLPVAALLLFLAASVAVCQPQSGIPENSAKILVQYGRVSALGSNGEQALFAGNLVKAQQMIVTGPDGYGQFQIADGSTFEVFANSRVMFRERPTTSMEDLLNVLLGRVKVFVQHLNGIPNYKKVSSPTAVISVRGTVFDVVVEDEDGTTLVSVGEGEVWVRNQTAPGSTVTLLPGDSIRVYRNQPIAVRMVDKGAIAMKVLKAMQQAVYQMIGRPQGPGLSVPGAGSTASAGANGDLGKTGTSDPGSSGPTAPGAPGSPSAPGAP